MKKRLTKSRLILLLLLLTAAGSMAAMHGHKWGNDIWEEPANDRGRGMEETDLSGGIFFNRLIKLDW